MVARATTQLSPLGQRSGTGRVSDQLKFGGASRARTDDLIVANDDMTGSSRLRFQSFAPIKQGKRLDLLERNWNVRKSGGSPQLLMSSVVLSNLLLIKAVACR
jgi:hypothetical protein